MAATMTLDGLIILLCIICFTCPGFILSRQWILRHRPRTAASLITDISILLFGAFLLTAAGLILTDCVIEKKLRRTLTDEMAILGKLATKSYLQRFFASGLLYTTELWLLKVSFLGYFANLRKHFSKSANMLYIFVCGYTAVSYIIVLGFQLGYCRPIQSNWEVKDLTKQCLTLKTLTVSTLQAMFNLSADVLVLVVALIVISSLKLGRRERVALLFVAAIGSVSIIMCTIRFVQVYEIIKNPASGNLKVTRQLYLWGTLETNFAIAAFCLPAYRAVLTRYWKRVGTVSKKMKDTVTIGGTGGRHSSKGGRSIRVDATVEVGYDNDSLTELNTVRQWDDHLPPAGGKHVKSKGLP